MAEAAPITLGGRTWTVRPLTIGQLKRVVPALQIAAGGVAADGFFDACIEILAAAIGRDDPTVTVEAIEGLEASPAEIAAAIGTITQLSGLVSSGEATAGSDSTA